MLHSANNILPYLLRLPWGSLHQFIFVLVYRTLKVVFLLSLCLHIIMHDFWRTVLPVSPCLYLNHAFPNLMQSFNTEWPINITLSFLVFFIFDCMVTRHSFLQFFFNVELTIQIPGNLKTLRIDIILVKLLVELLLGQLDVLRPLLHQHDNLICIATRVQNYFASRIYFSKCDKIISPALMNADVPSTSNRSHTIFTNFITNNIRKMEEMK